MAADEKAEEPQRRKLEDLRGRLANQLLDDPEKFREARDAAEAAQDPESGWEEKTSGVLARNIVMIFGLLVLAGLLIWGVIFKLTPPEELVRVPQRQKHFIETATTSEIAEEVESAVRHYMNARSAEERAEVVVGGQKTLLRMKEFEARDGVTVPEGFKSIAVQVNSATSGLPVVGVQATDQEDVVWSFSLVPGVGEMLIDWESSVTYGEMAWSEFMATRPQEEKLMRVYALRFFNEADRGKEEVPLYYRLSHRQDGGQLIAEPIRGSETEVGLKILVPKATRQPITVRVRFEAGKPFARITALVHPVWVDTDRAVQRLYE